jgi:hypothetical protein
MSNENSTHLQRLVEEIKQAYFNETPDTNRKTVVWADTTYQKLAKLLKNRIGVNTIRKIFTGQYIITSSTQKINTLSILCQFLGYTNWADFIEKYEKMEITDVDMFFNLIVEYNRKLWGAYKKLPKIVTSGFKKYLVEGSGYQKSIMNDFINKSDYNLYLADKSSYSIFGAVLKWKTNKKVCIQTRERILKDFEELYPTKKLVKLRGKGFDFHRNYIYLFIKKENGWKLGLKLDIGQEKYEDAKKNQPMVTLRTKKITYSYPQWREEFQQENFDFDDEEFELEYVDYSKVFPEKLKELKNKYNLE